jgi:hypothetical protein
MNKFILKKPIDLKKKVIFPVGMLALYFLSTYLFRNPYTSGILIVGIIAYAIYSIVTDRKYFIEFHRDILEFKKPSGRMIFSESIHELKIRKAEWRDQNRLIGQVIVFTANDGTEISIATYDVSKKWIGSVETLFQVEYTIDFPKWTLFVEKIGLANDVEDRESTDIDMQQVNEFRKKIHNSIFWYILGGATLFILITGGLFGWILLNYTV